jgi:pyrimidine-specific ribonucleoside hydrolase
MPIPVILDVDTGAVCALIDPDALTIQALPVAVDRSSGPSRGQTLVERRMTPGEDFHHQQTRAASTIHVAVDVDAGRYARLFLDTVTAAPGTRP